MKLAQHLGYMGGLQSNGSTGEHAVYYADASTELMFHISTRFNHEENMNIKGTDIKHSNALLIPDSGPISIMAVIINIRVFS